LGHIFSTFGIVNILHPEQAENAIWWKNLFSLWKDLEFSEGCLEGLNKTAN
jgi:hypothetical protein